MKYGLSTGLKRKSGKGERCLIVHMGSEDGWAPNAKKVWVRSKVFVSWVK